jgi:uncharacterized membrane protein YfcA
MNITTILLTIVLGCFSGVLGGAFGMGGTAFILPILIITKIIFAKMKYIEIIM